MEKLKLTDQQIAFMDVFGYLVFPGLLSDRIERITQEFENTFATQGGGHNGRPHDGSARSCILPFIDQTEYLASLIDDPRIDGIFTSLLGADYNYLGSDGNFYVGDTNWHSDTDWSGKMRGKPPRVFYKMALYLDPVTATSGALRVIPAANITAITLPRHYKPPCANHKKNWAWLAMPFLRLHWTAIPVMWWCLTKIPNTARGVAAIAAACSPSTAPPAMPMMIFRCCATKWLRLPASG